MATGFGVISEVTRFADFYKNHCQALPLKRGANEDTHPCENKVRSFIQHNGHDFIHYNQTSKWLQDIIYTVIKITPNKVAVPFKGVSKYNSKINTL